MSAFCNLYAINNAIMFNDAYDRNIINFDSVVANFRYEFLMKDFKGINDSTVKMVKSQSVSRDGRQRWNRYRLPTCPVRSGPVRFGQVRSGPVRSVRSGPVWSSLTYSDQFHLCWTIPDWNQNRIFSNNKD
jgi:hypothetical protein